MHLESSSKVLARRRLLIAVGFAAGLAATAFPAGAAQITWTGTANGSTTADWQNSGNWSGVVPINTTNTALFTNTGTYNSVTAATIDADGTFSVGEIQFSTTTAGTTTPPISINNSLGGIVSLTNAVGVLVQNKQTNPVTLNTNLALAPTTGGVTAFQITQATTVNGVISGSGNLLKDGSAALGLKGVNTYTGATTIRQNNLQIGANAPSGSPGALGNSSSAVQLGDPSASGTTGTQVVTLVTTGQYTVGRDIAVNSTASTGAANLGGSASQLNTSTFSGQVTLSRATNLQSSTTGAGVVDFTGQITGTGGITKTGTGAVQLDNANDNYSGGTSVSAGTLLLNGAGLTGGGAVAVNAGTFGGSGSISTSGLTLANGAVLAPGLIAGGTQNSGVQLGITGGATLDGTLAIEADTSTSELTVSGSLSLNPDSTLNFTATSQLTAPVYVVATYGSLSGTFGAVSNTPSGYSVQYGYNGNAIALVASSAPEPASLGVAALAGAGLLIRRGGRSR